MVAVDGAGGNNVLAFVHEGQLGVVAHCGGKLAAMKNSQNEAKCCTERKEGVNTA